MKIGLIYFALLCFSLLTKFGVAVAPFWGVSNHFETSQNTIVIPTSSPSPHTFTVNTMKSISTATHQAPYYTFYGADQIQVDQSSNSIQFKSSIASISSNSFILQL